MFTRWTCAEPTYWIEKKLDILFPIISLDVKLGPNEDESYWELALVRLIDYHQAWVKQKKTLDDSQEKFVQVQIRWERMTVAESAWEFQAKREREFELSAILILGWAHLAWPGFMAFTITGMRFWTGRCCNASFNVLRSIFVELIHFILHCFKIFWRGIEWSLRAACMRALPSLKTEQRLARAETSTHIYKRNKHMHNSIPRSHLYFIVIFWKLKENSAR